MKSEKQKKVIDIIARSPKKTPAKLREEPVRREPASETPVKTIRIAQDPETKNAREESPVVEMQRRPYESPREHETMRHHEHRKKGKAKWFLIVPLVVVLLAVGGYAAFVIMPSANIKIVIKKAGWEYNNGIVLNSQISTVDVAKRQVPMITLSQKKNATLPFAATGKENVERKATGKVIVYNAYNTSPQILIATTRLEAPGGKIFRLKDRIVVPAAKMENGKIVPVGIEAEVEAENAGDSYNIGPTPKLTIPGFSGSDKFSGFYAESKSPIKGGLIGQGPVPTQTDIDKAKIEAEKMMREVLDTYLYSQVPQTTFKIIEDTKKFNLLKETVNTRVDDEGRFSVFIEAEGSLTAFKEDDMMQLLIEMARQVIGPEYELKQYSLDYGKVETSSNKDKTMGASVNFKGIFWRNFNEEEFKKGILNKTEDELKAFVFSSPSIEKAEVSLWPMWVTRVPQNPQKSKIVIE